ncbi:hypothetical protein K503DRAFT_785803 [Rhizopogon vinicolor AM-OR11-026]|uniref:Uncharacterized protein n=1 Tax=Rhizopogon vinicolor AM-OR11-026 TaxID=1314800 RepID=A0A1B7MP54_9AGAM|nr:hypothetical protein K503DRAFT_785803 [Rhizopogon vinicolor AM-OR11-026]
MSSDVETTAARRSPTPAPSASSSGAAPPKNVSSGDVQDGTLILLSSESIKPKADLQAACDTYRIVYGKKTKLDSLRDRLVRHCVSESGRPGQSSEGDTILTASQSDDTSIGDAELLREFSVEGGDAEDRISLEG